MPTSATQNTSKSGIIIPKHSMMIKRLPRRASNKYVALDEQHNGEAVTLSTFLLREGVPYKFSRIKGRTISLEAERIMPNPIEGMNWNIKKIRRIRLRITDIFIKEVIVFSGRLPV